MCDALLEGLARHGIPEQILTDNGKVFTGKLARKPANVLFDRICLNNGIKHILTAPYSPTTTGKVERLHKTMRKEFFSEQTFETIDEAQTELDGWVKRYNTEREHQAIGDVAPSTRFALHASAHFDVVDGDVQIEHAPPRVLVRRVDAGGRIYVLRYHVGRNLAGEQVHVESADGLLQIRHNGAVVATHARRHLAEQDEAFGQRRSATTPSTPTVGDEVSRLVNSSGAVSFAGTEYRVGNAYRGVTVGVRVVGDTVQITLDAALLRTHRARHNRGKEFGALAQPNGKAKRDYVA